MTNRQVFVGAFRAALLTTGLLLGTAIASAQAQPAPPANQNEQTMDRQQGQHDWDEFLGKHPDLREQMIKNPNLVNDPAFRAQHPGMEQFMKEHPGVARNLKEDPNAVMRHSRHYAKAHHAGDRHPGKERPAHNNHK
jgi:hypothetical protein